MQQGRSRFIVVLFRKICMFVPWLRPLLGKPIILILVRHAQSVWNETVGGKIHIQSEDARQHLEQFGGGADHKLPITELGQEQAIKAGKYLAQFQFWKIIPDIIIHSGYLRTAQTAQLIMHAYPLNIPMKASLLWREREGGYTHSMIQSEVDEHLPFVNKYWKQLGGLFARAAGGESLMDVIEHRIIPAFTELNNNHAGQTVMVVTHGNTIRCCRVYLDQMELEVAEHFLNEKSTVSENCGITFYKYCPYLGRLTFHSYCDEGDYPKSLTSD